MSELSKTFLIGVQNDSGVLHWLCSMDTHATSPFFSLERVTCKGYAVYKSTEGICGVEILNRIEGKAKKVQYKTKAKTQNKARIDFSPNEHIEQIIIGSLNNGINALEINTNRQKFKIGDINESDYRERFDKTHEDRVVVGFDINFNDRLMVDLSVLTTKLRTNTPKLKSKLLNCSKTLRNDKKHTRAAQLTQFKQAIQPSYKSF